MIPDLAALLVPKTGPVPTAAEGQSWPDAFAAFLQELSPEVVPETVPDATPETEVPEDVTEVAEVQPRFQTVTELHVTTFEAQPKDQPALPEVTDAPVEDAPLPDATEPAATEVIEQPVITQTPMPTIMPVAPQLAPRPVSPDTPVAANKPKPESASIVMPQPALIQPAPQFQTEVQHNAPPDAAPLPIPAPVSPKPAKAEQPFEPNGEMETPLPIPTKSAAPEVKSEPTPVPSASKTQELPQTKPAPLPREPAQTPEVHPLSIPQTPAPKAAPAEPLEVAEPTPLKDSAIQSIQPAFSPDRPIHQPERTHAQPHIEPRQIAQQLAVVVREQPEGVTEIALSPEELGSVKMQVTVQNDSVTVVIAAEKPETGELMRRHLDTLSQEFRDLGYRDVNLGFSQGSRQQTPQGQTAAVTEPEPEPETQTAPTDGVDIRL